MKKLTAKDVGCFADGSNGHDYVRRNLRELLIHFGCEDADLLAALRTEMSDDASEEYEAIEWLNDHAIEPMPYFELENGDLLLVINEEEDQEGASDD